MSSLLYIVWLAAFVWSLYDIWTGKKDQEKKILWTAVCLLLPVLGTLIYVLVGKKK